MSAQEQLAAVIAGLETQRALLGDEVADMALAPLRARLAALSVTAPTAPPAAPEQTLKQVTVLFLDVVGSTALAQYLDPEDIHAVMDRVLTSGTAIVEASALVIEKGKQRIMKAKHTKVASAKAAVFSTRRGRGDGASDLECFGVEAIVDDDGFTLAFAVGARD